MSNHSQKITNHSTPSSLSHAHSPEYKSNFREEVAARVGTGQWFCKQYLPNALVVESLFFTEMC